MTSPFVKPTDQYKRNFNVVGGYINQNAHLLHWATGKPLDECREFVKDSINPKKGGQLHDPEALVLDNSDDGNRKMTTMSFLEFIKTVENERLIMSPAMNVYLPPEVKKSPLAEFIGHGIRGRKASKDEMYKYENEGNEFMANRKNAEQNAKKIDINSLSGVQASKGTPWYNKSAHSSLTSMCGSATSYGNALNEKFITGKRHLYSLSIVLSDIASIVTQADINAIDHIMRTHNLYYPQVDDVLSIIKSSTDRYFTSQKAMSRIRRVLCGMRPVELAAVAYVGDLHHLMQYNPEFVLKLFDDMLTPIPVADMEEADAQLKALDTDTRYFVNYCNEFALRGKNQSKIRDEHPEVWMALASSGKAVVKWTNDYAEFISTMWRSESMPLTIGNFGTVVRETVLTSDTDSTIFTQQSYVDWYGAHRPPEVARNVWYAITYISTQLIVHILAQMSSNIGMSKEHTHLTSMKNEYAFPVYSLTPGAKHYYAFNSAREGLVFDDYRMEIKGVHLRNSKIAPDIIKDGHALMRDLLYMAERGEQVSLFDLYAKVYDWEMRIKENILAGGTEYYLSSQIKSTYKSAPMSSPLFHHIIWEEVFAPKYGHVNTLPYDGVSVQLNLNNKTVIQEWIDSIDDRQLADRLATFIAKSGRTDLGVIVVPSSIIIDKGMPTEIIPVVDVRKVTYNSLRIFYTILESLGVYFVNADLDTLVQDLWSPEGLKQPIENS